MSSAFVYLASKQQPEDDRQTSFRIGGFARRNIVRRTDSCHSLHPPRAVVGALLERTMFGTKGIIDDVSQIQMLEPLNAYGRF
jgi:hypothetical protein